MEPPADPSQSTFALSVVDVLALVVSTVGATILHCIRQHLNGRTTERGQWLADALSFGTVTVLALIGIESLAATFRIHLALPNLAKANGLLIATALVYCVMMIVKNLCASVKR